MLSDAIVYPTIPVTDIDRARDFYQNKLGMSPSSITMPPDRILFEAGRGSKIYVYVRKEPSIVDHALASFVVDDIEKTVDELSEKGVNFEKHIVPGSVITDDRGVAIVMNVKLAWFKDPDGNILSLTQIL